MDADLKSPTRMVELMGTPEQISKAEQLINDVLAGVLHYFVGLVASFPFLMCLTHFTFVYVHCSNQAESGGQGIVSRRISGQAGSEQFVMKIPNNKVTEAFVIFVSIQLVYVAMAYNVYATSGWSCNR